eukprot:GHUV01006335.1.p1 GENE.GHUV01006335.1~~GHUV01006335.1.p1  ORF type:complete len:168 (+),score=26.47 GHUV01006335.1:453-956(+)
MATHWCCSVRQRPAQPCHMHASWRAQPGRQCIRQHIPCSRCIIVRSDSNENHNATTQQQPADDSKYSWHFDLSQPPKPDPKVQDVPVASIRRPLGRTRSNDQAKVEALMKSIQAIGLQEPIDVLLVDGVYYGFSGCHRFEAHQRLGLETIKCRVRKANKQVLKMHMM